ncbi:unnamed protein product [Linum trigynum]|uniref:Uncharacterized protein n=1 Tax=Linum trigynum TaxID=586398 RepID=A0AAV2EE16_9ROSI
MKQTTCCRALSRGTQRASRSTTVSVESSIEQQSRSGAFLNPATSSPLRPPDDQSSLTPNLIRTATTTTCGNDRVRAAAWLVVDHQPVKEEEPMEASSATLSLPIVAMAVNQSSRSLETSLAEVSIDIERKGEAEAVVTLRVNSTRPEVTLVAQVTATAIRKTGPVVSTAAPVVRWKMAFMVASTEEEAGTKMKMEAGGIQWRCSSSKMEDDGGSGFPSASPRSPKVGRTEHQGRDRMGQVSWARSLLWIHGLDGG